MRGPFKAWELRSSFPAVWRSLVRPSTRRAVDRPSARGRALPQSRLRLGRCLEDGWWSMLPGVGYFSSISRFALAVIVISVWRVPESRNETAGPIDKSGAFFATVGLGGLIVGLIESVNLGWRNPVVFGSLIIGLGCLVAFVFIRSSRRVANASVRALQIPQF